MYIYIYTVKSKKNDIRISRYSICKIFRVELFLYYLLFQKNHALYSTVSAGYSLYMNRSKNV